MERSADPASQGLVETNARPVGQAAVCPTGAALGRFQPLGLGEVVLAEGAELGDWQRRNAREHSAFGPQLRTVLRTGNRSAPAMRAWVPVSRREGQAQAGEPRARDVRKFRQADLDGELRRAQPGGLSALSTEVTTLVESEDK